MVGALTPRWVAEAATEPEQVQLMRRENMWQPDDFVIEAGCVNEVSERYRTSLARHWSMWLHQVSVEPGLPQGRFQARRSDF